MAEVAKGVFIAMAGIDLSCALKSVKTSGQADMKDSTTLCATEAKTYKKGLTERTISAEGFFQSSAFTVADINGLFQTALTERTADRLVLLGRAGATTGAVAEMFNVRQVKYDIDTTVGELLMASMEAKVTESDTAAGYASGVFLFYNTAVVAQTNGTTYDTTTGATGYVVQAHTLDGDDSVQVAIQHSTDGSTWVDLVEFTNVANYSATEIKSTVAVVNRYVRAVVLPNGTTNSVAVAMKIGYTG